jgi:hypothetical protein
MSRELDARVAEKVMEFKVYHNNVYDEYLLPEVPTKSGDFICELVPNYSTDMNFALDVVAELNKRKHYFFMDQPSGDLWEIEIERAGGYLDFSHKSLPQGVCLAALIAVGDKDWVDKYLEEK